MLFGDKSSIIDAFVEDRVADSIARYQSRGRPLAGLTREELEERWVTVFRAWAVDWQANAGAAERADIEAEMKLRNLRPPYDRVPPEVAALQEQAAVALRHIEADPELHDRLRARLEIQIATFLAFMGGSSILD